MSHATDVLLQALHFDETAGTFTLHAGIGRLGAAATALRAAFSSAHIALTEAQIVDPPPSPEPGITEVLALHGVAEIFGHHSRELYLELGITGGEVQTLLLLVPLPEKGWKLATGFPALAAATTLADLRLRDGVIVVSQGLRRVAGSRTVFELDRGAGDEDPGTAPQRVERPIALSPYDLQDGLQIVADGLVNGSAALAEIWDHAEQSGLAPEPLPDRNSDPARVEIRGHVEDNGTGGWLQLECWWENSPSLPGLAQTSGAHAAGLAVRFDLTQPDQSYHFWLREIGTAVAPIRLEAYVMEGFTPRYTTQPGAHIPLGESAAALATLVGAPGGLLQDLPFPDSLSLHLLSYSPGESLLLTVGAGDADAAGKHLLAIGPFELSEVDFTIAIPLKDGPGAPIVELTGFLEFAGVHFQVHVRAWDLIEGELDEPDGVHLGRFLADVLPVSLPFGLETVTLRQSSLQRVLTGSKDGEATTTLRIKLDGRVDLLPNAITLDAITLDVHKPDKGAALGEISADLMLGPISLSAYAERTADGWIFEGVGNAPPGGFSLTALVDHLVHAFGATVPADLPDVSLERVALRYDSASRMLDIQAVTDWTFDDKIPVLGGATSKAILQLTVARDRQQGTNRATLFIDWTLHKPINDTDAVLTLEAQSTLSAETQSFGVDLSLPAGAQHFSDLVRIANLPDLIPSQAQGVLDAILQVESLSLNYTRPGNLIDIAWSRQLGEGSLLMEFSQSSQVTDDAANSSAGRAVKVSWMGHTEESTIGLKDLLCLLSAEEWADVGGVLDELLIFKQLGFTWAQDAEQEDLTLTALSTYGGGSEAFLAVLRGQNPGLVVGVALGQSSLTGAGEDRFSFLSGDGPGLLQKLLDAAETVLDHVELTHLQIATVSSQAYRPPSFAPGAMSPGMAPMDAAATYPFGSQTVPLQKGLAVGVRVHFGKDDVVRRVIDVDEIDGQVTISPDQLALQIWIPKRLKLDGGGGNKLALTAPLLKLAEVDGLAEITIGGSLDLQLFGQRVDASAWLTLSEEALNGHIQLREMSLIDHVALIPVLPGVMLVVDEAHALSFELGLEFEPPGFDMGFQASFAIYKNADDMVTGRVGLVLELMEELPMPQYVAFEIDEMSIPVLLEAVTGIQYRLHELDALAKKVAAAAEDAADSASAVNEIAGGDAANAVAEAGHAVGGAAESASSAVESVESALGHVEAILSGVELKDVSIHWAESIVDLPDGTTATPGVGLRADLHIFGWDAFAVLDIASPTAGGISGHFETETIELGNVLHIWGDGKGIRKPPKTADDFNSDASDKDAASASPKSSATAVVGAADSSWFIEPGGPVLHFSTHSSPFFHANLHAQLFGVLQTDIEADITDEGFAFHFHIGAGAAASADLECHWWHKEGKLEAHGDMDVHLHGSIGPLIPHVTATQFQLDVDLDAHVKLLVDSEHFKFSVNGSFDFQGHQMYIPELVIDVRFATLAELVERIWDHVVEKAEEIFVDITGPVGKALEAAAVEVAAVATEAAHEVAKVTAEAAHEAVQIGKDVADVIGQAADALSERATALVDSAKDVAAHAAQEALDVAKPFLDEAVKIGEQVLQVAKEAAEMAAAIIDEGVQAIKDAARYVQQKLAEVARAVSEMLDRARQWVAGELSKAWNYANQLAREADAIVADIEDQISSLLSDVEDVGEDALDTLSSLI